MASGNRGPIVVAIVGAAIASVSAATYLLYIAPKKAKSTARVEVEELATRWLATRTCLAGEKPFSNDLGEAVILTELSVLNPAEHFRGCEALLVEAGRAKGYRNQHEFIEEAWQKYRVGRSTLAKALAHYGAKRRVKPLAEIREYLAAGTAEADAAYQALRANVDLPADALSGSALPGGPAAPLEPSLTAADTEVLAVKNNKVLAIDVGSDPRRLLRIDGTRAEVTSLRRGVNVAAAPAPGWGVAIEDDQLLAWELDGDRPPMPIAKLKEGEQFVGAIGNRAGERLVVTIGNPELPRVTSLYANVSPGAPFVKRQDLLADVGYPSGDLDLLFGRLTVRVNNTTLEWSPKALATPIRHRGGSPCFADNASWWLGDDGLTHLTSGESSLVRGSMEMPWSAQSCTDTQAMGASLSRTAGVAKVRLCSRSECPVSTELPLPDSGRIEVLIAPTRGPVVVTTISDVALAWTSGPDGGGLLPSAAINLGDNQLLGLLELGSELAAVVSSDEGIGLIRFR